MALILVVVLVLVGGYMIYNGDKGQPEPIQLTIDNTGISGLSVTVYALDQAQYNKYMVSGLTSTMTPTTFAVDGYGSPTVEFSGRTVAIVGTVGTYPLHIGQGDQGAFPVADVRGTLRPGDHITVTNDCFRILTVHVERVA
jgi:hypothetical protein